MEHIANSRCQYMLVLFGSVTLVLALVTTLLGEAMSWKKHRMLFPSACQCLLVYRRSCIARRRVWRNFRSGWLSGLLYTPWKIILSMKFLVSVITAVSDVGCVRLTLLIRTEGCIGVMIQSLGSKRCFIHIYNTLSLNRCAIILLCLALV